MPPIAADPIAEETFRQFDERYPIPEQRAQQRGILGQAIAGVARGAVGLAQLPLEAASAIPPVRPYAEPAARYLEERKPLPSGGAVESGVEMGVTGLGVAAGATALGPIGGAVAAGTLFGASTFAHTRTRLEQLNETFKAQGLQPLTDSQITLASLGAGAIMGVGQGAIASWLGPQTRAGAEALQRTIVQRFLPAGAEAMLSRAPASPLVKGYIDAALRDIPTFAGAAAGEAATTQAVMTPEQQQAAQRAGFLTPGAAAAASLAPTAVMAAVQPVGAAALRRVLPAGTGSTRVAQQAQQAQQEAQQPAPATAAPSPSPTIPAPIPQPLEATPEIPALAPPGRAAVPGFQPLAPAGERQTLSPENLAQLQLRTRLGGGEGVLPTTEPLRPDELRQRMGEAVPLRTAREVTGTVASPTPEVPRPPLDEQQLLYQATQRAAAVPYGMPVGPAETLSASDIQARLAGREPGVLPTAADVAMQRARALAETPTPPAAEAQPPGTTADSRAPTAAGGAAEPSAAATEVPQPVQPRLSPTDLADVRAGLRALGFTAREITPVLDQLQQEGVASVEAATARGIQLLQREGLARNEPPVPRPERPTPPAAPEAETAPPEPPPTPGEGPSGQQITVDIEKPTPEAAAAPAEAVPPPSLGPGTITQMAPGEIAVDPERFQYKVLRGSKGTTGSLGDVERFDPQKAGVVQVWTDPADGKTYVINGHNRVDLAKRANAPAINVMHIDATTPEEARATGALTNIAEGRGTAIDAATFFRESGKTPQDLVGEGVSIRDKLVKDGVALANLNPTLFGAVTRGEFPLERAVIIGERAPDHAAQLALVRLLDQQQAQGRRLTNEVVRELADMATSASQQTNTEMTLFGAEETTTSLAVEKAQTMAYISQRLAREKRLFGTVGQRGAAQELTRGGNVIDVEGSQAIATNAAQLQSLFDRLKNQSGPINDAINRAVARIGAGDNAATVRSALYDQLLTDLPALVRGTMESGGEGNRALPGSAPGVRSPAEGTVPEVSTPEPGTAPGPEQPGQLRTTTEPPPGAGRFTRAQVAAEFPGQRVTEDAATGQITVRTRGGHTLTIEHVGDITPTEAELRLSTGRSELLPGARVGGRITQTGPASFHVEVREGETILTLRHEALGHFLEDSGLLRSSDIRAIDRALERAGQTPDPETRAEWVAQQLGPARERLQGPLGQVVRTVQQWFDRLARALGFTTGGQVVRRIESGAIFERDANGNLAPGRLQVMDFPREREQGPFGKSVVRTAQGLLKAVYHGTQRSFETFDPRQKGSASGQMFDGVFFAEDPQVAGRYARANRQDLHEQLAALEQSLQDLRRRAAEASPTGYAETLPPEVVRYEGRELAHRTGSGYQVTLNLTDPASRRMGGNNFFGDTLEDARANALNAYNLRTFGESNAYLTTVIRQRQSQIDAVRQQIQDLGLTGPNVRPAYLNITRPFDTKRAVTTDDISLMAMAIGERYGQAIGEQFEAQAQRTRERRGLTGADLYRGAADFSYDANHNRIGKRGVTELLQDMGYDGLYHEGAQDGKVWVAFSPDQIVGSFRTEGRLRVTEEEPELRSGVPPATPRRGVEETEDKAMLAYANFRATLTPEDVAHFQQLAAEGKAPQFTKEVIPDVKMAAAGQQQKSTWERHPGEFQTFLKGLHDNKYAATEAQSVALNIMAGEELQMAKALRDAGAMDAARFQEFEDKWLDRQSVLHYDTMTGSTAGRTLRLRRMLGADPFVSGLERYAAAKRALDQKVNAIPEADRPAFLDKLRDALLSGDPLRMQELARQIPSPSYRELFFEMYYNSLMSGVGTHATNFFSTEAYQLFHNSLVRPVAGAIDWSVSKLTGRERQLFASEALPALQSQFRTLPQAFKEAWWLWRGDPQAQTIPSIHRAGSVTGVDLEGASGAWARATWPDGRPIETMRKLAPAMTFATHAADAMDVAMRHQVFDAEVAALARREALQRFGAPNEAFERNYQRTFMSEQSQRAIALVNEVALKQTFHDAPGILANLIGRLHTVPGLGFFFQLMLPFRNTPDRLLARGLELLPGPHTVKWAYDNASWKWGGWLPLPGREAFTNDAMAMLAKQMIGLGLTAGIYALWNQGKVTAGAPDTPAERDAFYRSGKVPYAIQVGDTWYSWRRFEPLSLPLGMMTTAFDALDRRQAQMERRGEVPVNAAYDSLAIAAVGVQSAIHYVLDNSYFAGLANFIEGTAQSRQSGTGDIPRGVMRQIASAITPFIGLQRSLVRAIDASGIVPGIPAGATAIRRPDGLGETIATSWLPLAFTDLAAKPGIDVFGRPQLARTSTLGEVLPVPPISRGLAPSSPELEQAFQDLRYFPSAMSRGDATGKRYSNEDYTAMSELRGSLALPRLEQLVQSPGWSRMTPDAQRKMLQNILSDAGRTARAQVMRGRHAGAAAD